MVVEMRGTKRRRNEEIGVQNASMYGRLFNVGMSGRGHMAVPTYADRAAIGQWPLAGAQEAHSKSKCVYGEGMRG